VLYNLDKYLGQAEDPEKNITLNQNCILLQTPFINNTTISIIEEIQETFSALNIALDNGGSAKTRENTYNSIYSPMTYEKTKGINFDTLKTSLELGAIGYNNSEMIINKIGHELENIIDTALLDSDWTIDKVLNSIKQKNIYASLPGADTSVANKVDIQAMVVQYVTDYLTANA